jgi:AhpD family alkylhydroperoxidase
MPTGSDTLRTHAPAAADALDVVVAATWSAAEAHGLLDLVAEAARRSAALHGIESLLPPTEPGHDRPGTSGPSAGGDPVILGFAEQCCLDVAAVSPEQRAGFLAAAGPAAGDLAAALWVVDIVPRTRAALDALAGPGPWPVAPVLGTAPGSLWSALDGLIRTVPALDALDAVTSELVRLRGARQHRCRLCMSIRSRPALLAGADESTFAAVDAYEDSGLGPLPRAALAFTDGMLWTPGHLDPEVVADLARVATPAQQVELVLDVTRNALNKIAVALGADAAHVEDGTEIYDVGPDGTLVYGLTLD